MYLVIYASDSKFNYFPNEQFIQISVIFPSHIFSILRDSSNFHEIQ